MCDEKGYFYNAAEALNPVNSVKIRIKMAELGWERTV